MKNIKELLAILAGAFGLFVAFWLPITVICWIASCQVADDWNQFGAHRVTLLEFIKSQWTFISSLRLW